MVRLACLAVGAALVLSSDVSGALHLQPSQQDQQNTPQSARVLLASSGTSGAQQQSAKKDGPLQEESRLQILRLVDGEFAHLLTSLPGGKKGFHFRAGEPIDQNALRQAIRSSGAALNSGDNVQITRLEFQDQAILIDLNGGGKQGSWKDRVQLQMGLPTDPTIQTSTRTTETDGARPVIPEKKTGATLYLDFGRPLPDMTPEQVKQYLSVMLDFSKERSAAAQWTDTMPPKLRQAIAERRPEVGMDRDEVLAAIGRPERKVRERERDGTETEDWIYGRPPAKTIFVEFTGDKVTQVHQYPE